MKMKRTAKRQPFGSAHVNQAAALQTLLRKSLRIVARGYRSQGQFWDIGDGRGEGIVTTSPRRPVLALFLVSGRPAHAGSDRGPIEFALDQERRAAVVEPEDFIVEVEAVHNEAEAMCQAVAALNVNFKVGVQVSVAVGAAEAAGSRRRATRTIMELIAEDVRLVVGEASAHGEPAAVVGWADIPSSGGGTYEPGMIGAPRQAAGARGSVANICRNAEAAESAREESKVLQIGRFKPLHPSAASVDGLRHGVGIGSSRSRRRKGFEEARGHDRVGKVFVEIPSGNQAEGL